MSEAIEVSVHAPVVSFRDPLYDGVQATLPCPPPSTVAGLLAAAAGGWEVMPRSTTFAMSFTARGSGTDLETFHPLDAAGRKADPTPKDRPFLAEAVLTLWLADDLGLWERAMRRPVWPLRLGRSQDLASARSRRVLLANGAGTQRQALLPDRVGAAGRLLRLPTVVGRDRARTRWDAYWYAETSGDVQVDTGWVTEHGQAVAFLPPVHPDRGLE